MLTMRQSFPAKSGLDVRVKGDSAFGTWTATEPAAPPVEMRGKISGATLMLQGTREAHVMLNGEASTVVILTRFDLTRAQDEVTGTLRTMTETGERVLSSLPVKGKLTR